jgi:hypothetical protein
MSAQQLAAAGFNQNIDWLPVKSNAAQAYLKGVGLPYGFKKRVTEVSICVTVLC